MTRARRLLGILHGCVDRHAGDAERTLALIEISAQVAWLCHAGTFVLPQAERLLHEHAERILPQTPCGDWMRAVEGRTLHVLSEAYGVGGHTLLVKRWIELLDEEPHAVVLVRQLQSFDPSWVVPAGRHVPRIDLHAVDSSRCRKVAWLASLFGVARRVILHIHPNDACSVAAAYRSPQADIHFLNHADHVAWLGAGLPVVYLNLRQRGTRLAETRRGIAASTCGVVPIPITPPVPVDRCAARRKFGLVDGDCLLLTVASAYKFTPVGRRSLLEPLDRLLCRRDVKLMAVGVDAGHPVFGILAERHPGQVMCMGIVPSPTAHRAAADIYLDSYPFCSVTSMLESAALGTPVVAYRPDQPDLDILYSECPWLPAEHHEARDAGGLVELLHALIDDRALRQEMCLRNIEGMKQHFPSAWRAAVRRHLMCTFTKPPWRRPDRPFGHGLLDEVLSELMSDVLHYTSQPDALGLDEIGRDRIMRRELRGMPESGL